MSIFSVFQLFGGLAFFLYGMEIMGGGLEKMSGGKLERILENLTSNRIKGVLLGAAVTAVIQSSSAVTVMLVGFVNSGIMQLSQAIGVIMGANMGTTATAWILSLAGIQGDSFFVQLLKPVNFSPIIAVIGIVLLMFTKDGKKHSIGSIMIGFALLMFGMETMSTSMEPLAEMEGFANLLLMFKNPIFGVLAGAVLTGIIQSSSASVGILQALSLTGAVSFGAAIPIIMGQNIGTCVTALISAIGANKGAKRTACVHLYFNIIGTVLFLTLFYVLDAIFHFTFIDSTINAVGIAVVHTTFNVLSTLVLLPFVKQLEMLACKTIPDRESKDDKFKLLDERFLQTPAVAVEQSRTVTVEMAEVAVDTVKKAMQLLVDYSEAGAEEVIEGENKVDLYEDQLGTYLVKVSSKDLAIKDSRTVAELLNLLGNFERISDHAVNIAEAAQESNAKGIKFSKKAREELTVVMRALTDILELTQIAFKEGNTELAKKIEPMEEVMDELCRELKNRHVTRLQAGECTIENGFVFLDILTSFERISDHCSNVGVCLIQAQNDNHDVHEYTGEIKGDQEFVRQYNELLKGYVLPSSKA